MQHEHGDPIFIGKNYFNGNGDNTNVHYQRLYVNLYSFLNVFIGFVRIKSKLTCGCL